MFHFELIPQMLIVHIVYNVCLWLNAFPPANGITGGFSPQELVTGRKLSYQKDCRADVGAYVEANTDEIVTNGNNPRTQSCIALGPSGNQQGLLKCLVIETGAVVTRRTFTQLPWTDRLLAKVKVLARKNIKKIVKGNDIKFLNRHRNKFN